MGLIVSAPLAKRIPTDEDAKAALRQRPDIEQTEEGRRALEAMRNVGPAAVIALCKGYPTPDEETAAQRETRRRLRLAEVRRVASLALEARQCLDGYIPCMDDDTRRTVSQLIGEEHRYTVERLAWWSQKDAQHDIAPREDWREIRELAERQQVKELLTKTHSAIQQAIADSHVPKKRRKR